MKSISRWIVLVYLSFVSQTWAADFYGVASNADNEYRLQLTSGRTLLTLPQNEVAQVLLQDQHAVVQDIFRRVSWFDETGKTLVSQVPGAEFRVSDTLLGVSTPEAFAQVYDRSGKRIWNVQRPVSGLSVAQTRFAWIDRWRGTFELLDLSGQVLFTRAFVKKAAITEKFVYLVRESGVTELFGEGFRAFPMERPRQVWLSDQLALIQTLDGRVRAYDGTRSLWVRNDVSKVVLTEHYLALVDRSGLELFKPDGTFVTRLLSGVRTHYTNAGVVIQHTGGSVRLVRLSPEGELKLAVIPRADRVVVGPGLVMAIQNYFYEVYDFDLEGFGKKVAGGSRVIDSGTQVHVGLKTFGFLNPNARSAQVFEVNGGAALESGAVTRVLDQLFVSRLDLSTQAPALRWTIF